MISWTKYVFGQTREPAEAHTNVEDVLEVWPEKPVDASDKPAAALGVPAAPSMSERILRWPIILNLLLIMIGAVVICGLQMQRAHRLEQQLHAAQGQIDRLLVQNQTLNNEVAGLQAERHDLDDRVFSLGVQLSAASAELERANGRLEKSQQLSRQLSELQATFRIQMASERAEREAARLQAERLAREKSDLEHSVARLRQQLALLDRDYRKITAQLMAVQQMRNPDVRIATEAGPSPSLAASADALSGSLGVRGTGALNPDAVELSPIIIRKDRSSIATPPVRGRLLDINEPHRFVVIDKGSEDGVREGMTFEIIRGATSLGRAVAIKVRPRLAACNIAPDAAPDQLHPGDAVVGSAP